MIVISFSENFPSNASIILRTTKIIPREVAIGRWDGLRAGVLSQNGNRQIANTIRTDPIIPIV